MKEIFYRFLIALSKLMGQWVFRIIAWGIASGYFLFSPRRVAVSLRFYRALFPSKRGWHHLWCTWRQYHNFANVFLDRFRLFDDPHVAFAHEGWEYLENAVNSKIGGVILMSHMGNWEIAARLLQLRGRDNPGMKLLLYLGRKHKEQIERAQKESLVLSGVKIIAIEEGGSSPFDILEGINFLKAGGLVSLTGDRKWREDQRSIPVHFLGHEVFLPEAPFVLALLSGAPIFTFFAYSMGRHKYHFKILPPQYVHAQDRRERREAIRGAAQAYAECLEDALRHRPFEWYHFEQFIGRKLPETAGSWRENTCLL